MCETPNLLTPWDPKTSALTPQVLGGEPHHMGPQDPQAWDPQEPLIWESQDPKPPDPKTPSPGTPTTTPQVRGGEGGIHHVGPQKPQPWDPKSSAWGPPGLLDLGLVRPQTF